MSLSMTAEAQGKWEYVPSKKQRDQGKKDRKVEMKKAEVQEGLLDLSENSSAFAALDKWQKKRDATSDGTAAAAEPSKPRGNGVFNAEELANLTVGSAQAKPAPKQPKKPKVKKAKVSAKEVGASLSAADMATLLASLEQTYKEQDAAQCEMLANHLWKTFSEAELPFNKMLTEQPLSKTVEVPLQYVATDVAETISTWLAARSPAALQQLARNLILSVYDGLPDFNKNAKQAPPKAKVGLLLLLSLLLRTSPAVLVPLCPFLLQQGPALCAPLRVPQTIWMLQQLLMAPGQQGRLVGLHVFCQVMLPQIVGHSLASIKGEATKYTMMQKDSATTFLLWAQPLAEAAALATSNAGIPSPGGGAPTPAVPLGAVETAVRALYGGELEGGEPAAAPKGAPPRVVRDALAGLLAPLRAVAFAGTGGGGFPAEDALVLALETAEGSSGPVGGAGSRLVGEAACSVLCALAASPGAYDRWEEKHKKSIRGSARVLQSLAAKQARACTLLAAEGPRFGALLTALGERHRLFLEAGKGWQGAAAAAAQQALDNLGAAAKGAASRSAPAFWRRLDRMFFLGFVMGAALYAIAEPEHSQIVLSRLLPANVVVRAFEFIPPQATLQLRSLMAMASAQGHKAAQLVAEALPAEVMETLSTALKGANFTK
mmetsp:Transcript_10882/g.27934  ORF Transcript_10882/g.27934 Transcript_10882/m.27934 type:complete len:658 (+) Transcript_10882:102-2075(+)